MKKAIVIGLMATGLYACHKKQNGPQKIDDGGVETCIDSTIRRFAQSEFICNTGATVKKYFFQNDVVFVFDWGSCGNDFTSEVLNGNCDTIGYLGGISGNYIINGQSFDSATYIQTVWSN